MRWARLGPLGQLPGRGGYQSGLLPACQPSDGLKSVAGGEPQRAAPTDALKVGTLCCADVVRHLENLEQKASPRQQQFGE